MDGPFRVSAAILGIKMQTLMATVALLQLFNIFPKQGSCSKCSNKTSNDVKADGNYIYWWCSSCRVKTPIRRGTVLSNSNLKLERFVLLMFAFVHRGNTYIQIANDAISTSRDRAARIVALKHSSSGRLVLKTAQKEGVEGVDKDCEGPLSSCSCFLRPPPPPRLILVCCFQILS